MKINIRKTLTVIVASLLMTVGVAASTASAAQVPYNPNGTPTQTTPRFNMYEGVPNVGNEANFVLVRKSTGDPKLVSSSNPFVDPLNTQCKAGDMFDVRNYVHNGADPTHNNNGAGSAVAHNVNLALSAPIGTSASSFTFGSTISASSAASVSDNAVLNCGSNFKLELVPQKVSVYAKAYGWQSMADSSINSTSKIGSKTVGSGDVWACWDDRVIVVYTVRVVAVEQPPVPEYACDVLTVSKIGERKYRYNVSYSAKNGATLKDFTYRFGDSQSVTSANTSVEHTYATNGEYTASVLANFTVDGQVKTHTSAGCTKIVTVAPENCTVPGKGHLPKDDPACKEDKCTVPGKENLPKDDPACKSDKCTYPGMEDKAPNHPDCKPCEYNKAIAATDAKCVKPAPAALPVTGAEGMVGLFTAVTIGGAAAHRLVQSRRYS